MYLPLVKLMRGCFWAALAVGLLKFLLPQIPLAVPLGLAAGAVVCFLLAALHSKQTRRPGLRCPSCGWVPFALNAWKCRTCRFVWDAFATDGVCPNCGHRHDELACVRCRRIAPPRRWAVG